MFCRVTDSPLFWPSLLKISAFLEPRSRFFLEVSPEPTRSNNVTILVAFPWQGSPIHAGAVAATCTCAHHLVIPAIYCANYYWYTFYSSGAPDCCSCLSAQARLDHAENPESSRRKAGLKRISVVSTAWLHRETAGAIRVSGYGRQPFECVVNYNNNSSLRSAVPVRAYNMFLV